VTEEELLEVARVGKPHGIRGELKLYPHQKGSDALFEVEAVWLARDGAAPRRYDVESARPADDHVLVALIGVEDRDAAGELRGARVLVERRALPPLTPGEYYLADLVGALVIGPEGEVGRVIEVRLHPSIDALVIRRDGGEVVEQVLAEPWVESVDVAAGRVVLSSLGGLIE
jgi:16S rRNA processing protein RimM